MPSRIGTLKVLPAPGRRITYENEQGSAQARQAKRALPTNSTRWRQIRALVLREQPLCAECTKRNRIRAATQVDHRDGDASNNARTNLQGLCMPCHSRKTAAQDGSFGRPRRGPVESLGRF